MTGPLTRHTSPLEPFVLTRVIILDGRQELIPVVATDGEYFPIPRHTRQRRAGNTHRFDETPLVGQRVVAFH